MIVSKGEYAFTPYLFCDWYSGTVETSVDNLLEAVVSDIEDCEIRVAKGPAQYERTMGVFLPNDPEPLMIVSYGGNGNADPYFQSKGHHAHQVFEAMRKHFPVHKVTRMDVAVDFIKDGVYSEISGFMAAIHQTKGIMTRTINHDVPDMGRTHYLGARASRVMIRLYEKDKQLESMGKSFRVGHVRLEMEVKPKGRADKTKWATVSLEQAWGASPTSAKLIADVLSIGAKPIRREPKIVNTDEDKFVNLLKQYQKLLGNIGKDKALELLEKAFDDKSGAFNTSRHECHTTH